MKRFNHFVQDSVLFLSILHAWELIHVYREKKKIKSFFRWFHVIKHGVHGKGKGEYVKYQSLYGTDLLHLITRVKDL